MHALLDELRKEGGLSLDPGPNTQDILSLHGIALAMGLSLMVGPALGRRSSEESDIDVLVLAQFLERRHDLATDELLALGCALRGWGWGGGFQLTEGRAFVRQPLEDVDQDGVGLGDVEADVGDRVLDETVQDGEDGAGEDGEGEGW